MVRTSKIEILLRERLRRLRKQLNLTQTDIAEMSGISYELYKAFEQGSRPNLSIRVLEQLSDALGVEPYQLLSPIEPTPKLKSKPIPPPHYKKRQ